MSDKIAAAALGRCSKAMWWGYGAPAGTCDEPAWSGQIKGRYGEWINGYWYELSVGGEFACPRHGGLTEAEYVTKQSQEAPSGAGGAG